MTNAAAELTTSYYYTILRANLIGLEGEGLKEIAETARIEDRSVLAAERALTRSLALAYAVLDALSIILGLISSLPLFYRCFKCSLAEAGTVSYYASAIPDGGGTWISVE